MIVEFMGLPGVGKSYLGNYIVKKLKFQGIKCINYTEKSRSSIWNKAECKMMRKMILNHSTSRMETKSLHDILVDYLNVQPKYNESWVHINEYIDQIVFINHLQSQWDKSSTIYIFDEGILQQYANMIVNYGISDEVLRKIISFRHEICNVFYISGSIDTVKNQINKRNRHVSYIDELQGDDLDQFLGNYQQACQMIQKHIHPIVIDQNDDIRKNAEEVIQHVLGERFSK